MGGPKLQYKNLVTEDKYTKIRLEQTADIVIEVLEDNFSILDVGGYNGDLYKIIKSKTDKKFSYKIVDYDDDALKIANKLGADISKCNLELDYCNKGFENEKFDLIISTECLEHLSNPKKQLEIFKKILNENKYCIISLPNENTIYHRLMSLFGKGLDTNVWKLYKHLHLPTTKQSEELVVEFFKIKKISRYINLSFEYTRSKWLSVFKIVPQFIWVQLANTLPGLFARGSIFLCKKD